MLKTVGNYGSGTSLFCSNSYCSVVSSAFKVTAQKEKGKANSMSVLVLLGEFYRSSDVAM